MRRPAILVLDDSSSALDYATDAALRRAIREGTEGMTVFMVSQRVSAVKQADLILMLDDGELAGAGSHEELLATCEAYREICESPGERRRRPMKTDKPRTMRRLLGYVGRHKAALAGVFVFALIGNTSLLLAPKLIGRAIDLILPGTGGGYLAALLKTLAVIGVLYLAGSLFNWLTALCANLVANRTVRALRVDLFGKLGRLPLQYYDTHSHGDMMSRFTNDIDAISDGLNQGIVQLVSGVMTVLLSLAFMLSLNPMVTLVAVFVTPLCFLVGFAITKYGSRRFKEQSRTLGRLNGYAEELISGQRTVKAFGYEDRAVDGFDAINAELYQCGYRAQFASALVNPSTRFVNNVAYVLVGVFGILAVLKNALTPGGVASFLTYTAQFSKPFNEITAITMQLQLAMASARRVFAVLDGEEQRPESADAARLEAAEGSRGFRARTLRLPAGTAADHRFQPHGEAGDDGGYRGTHGGGKDHPGQPADAVL